jgi:hypothetical protein
MYLSGYRSQGIIVFFCSLDLHQPLDELDLACRFLAPYNIKLTCRPESEKSELINVTLTKVTSKSQADKVSDLLYGASF